MARVNEGNENGAALHPAFPGHPEAIVFSANDYYCPYLSVMLLSVLEHASASRVYDIVVLNRDITPENKARLRGMAEGMPNVSIRFLDVGGLLEGYSLYTGGKKEFSVDTYSRFFILDVLAPSYKKALYLDSDMLALADVGELLDTELDGCLLASTRDLTGLEDYFDPASDRKEYRDEVLGLEMAEDYFIAGMLVLNLDAFRVEYTSEALMQLAISRKWRQHDQDVLNVVCNGGRAKLLDVAWDVMMPYKPELLPPDYRAELEESLRSPKVVHFGGDQKPWRNTSSPWTMLFWETSARTPFYEEMVRRLLECSEEFSWLGDSQTPAFFRASHLILRKLYGGVRCLQDHGPAFTARRALEHLMGMI